MGVEAVFSIEEHATVDVIVALHKRPAFYALLSVLILRLRVLEYLSLLLLRAVEGLVLALELLTSVAWGWHRHPSR